MLSMLYVRLTIKVKVGIPESFKVGWYPKKITGSSHLKSCSGLKTMLTPFFFGGGGGGGGSALGGNIMGDMEMATKSLKKVIMHEPS